MDPLELRDFGPFVQECAKRGIGKTRAYALANEGLLDTGYVGKTRIVYLDSLLSLPQRLKAVSSEVGQRSRKMGLVDQMGREDRP